VVAAGEERRTGRSLTFRQVPAWAVFAVGSALVIVAYFALPALGLSGLGRGGLYTGLAVASALAILCGIVMRRPAAWRAWALLAIGQVLYGAGGASYVVAREVYHTEASPAVADAFFLLTSPIIAAGLIILVRHRTPRWHTPTVLDAAIVGTAAALLWWVYVLSPLTTAPGMSFAARLVSIFCPVMDLLVLVVALQLMLGAGARTLAYYLIVSSVVLMLAADVTYAQQTAEGTWRDFGSVDALWLASHGLLGAAALHPSARRLDQPSAVRAPNATWRRLAVLTVASLVAPAVLVIENARHRTVDVEVIAGACAALFLLVLTRMAGLVAAQRREAITDGLTNVHTRRFFDESLRIESERGRRGGAQLGLLLIDVDRFKSINDTYGHQAGDRVLVELAHRLRQSCRPGDVVARFGGEEFAVLLPDTGPERLARVAERVRRGVDRRPFAVSDGTSVPVTVSVGAASLPAHRDGGPEAVRMADQALYAAKRAGRNRVANGNAGRSDTDDLIRPRHGERAGPPVAGETARPAHGAAYGGPIG
jgi:diguanylate cyclase (GGDEF)-like protein